MSSPSDPSKLAILICWSILILTGDFLFPKQSIEKQADEYWHVLLSRKNQVPSMWNMAFCPRCIRCSCGWKNDIKKMQQRYHHLFHIQQLRNNNTLSNLTKFPLHLSNFDNKNSALFTCTIREFLHIKIQIKWVQQLDMFRSLPRYSR